MVETMFPMYIGTGRYKTSNPDPGSTDAYNHFKVAHRMMCSTLAARNSKRDIQTLENELNSFFFPKANDSASNALLKEFNKAIVSSYNDIKHKSLLSSTAITDNNYFTKGKNIKTSFQKTKQKLEEEAEKTVEIHNRQVGNLLKQLDQLKTLRKELGKAKQVKEYDALIEQLDNKYGQSFKDIQTYLNKILNDTGVNTRNLNNVSYLISKAKGTRVSEKDILEHITIFDKYFSEIRSYFTVNNEVYGTIWEYALDAFANYKEGVITSTDKEVKKILKGDLKNGKLAGGNQANRGTGSIFEISTYIEDVDSNYNPVLFNAEDEAVIKYGKESLTLKYEQKINPYEEKYGKMDVEMKFDTYEPLKGNVYKVSAKSWKTDGDFGETDLLSAIERTNNREVLSRYVYAMQQPTDGDYDRGYNLDAIMWGHEIARASLLLDIVMGYSQKNNYADTAIILNRSRNKVKVVDIVGELYDKIFNTETDKKNKGFVLHGYDEVDIEQKAIFIRNSLGRDIANSSSSRVYSGLMYLYLHSKKMNVTYKN